jgi:hypothetical protein
VTHEFVLLGKLAPSYVTWRSAETGGIVEGARMALRRHRKNHKELAWQEYIESNIAQRNCFR